MSFGDLSEVYGKPHVYLLDHKTTRHIRYLSPPLTKRGQLERQLRRCKVKRVVRIEIFGDFAFLLVKRYPFRGRRS